MMCLTWVRGELLPASHSVSASRRSCSSAEESMSIGGTLAGMVQGVRQL